MLVDATRKVTRHTNVKGAVRFVSDDVNKTAHAAKNYCLDARVKPAHDGE